jgi:hypothetical protein
MLKKIIKQMVGIVCLLTLQQSLIAQSSNHKIHLSTTDDKRVAIAITIDDIPDQRFIFTIPEVFTMKGFEGGQGGLGSFSGQDWKLNNDGGSVSLEDSNYKYSIKLDLVEKPNRYSVKWKIKFENHSGHVLNDLSSFNCVSMKAAPLFKDDLMNRTWVSDINGNKKLIKDVAKTQGPGRRTMQFYPALRGAEDLSGMGWIQQWDVNSTEVLSGHGMSIISKDSKWIVDTKVDGKVAYFFNNFEITHGCIHAAPLIAAALKPNRSAKASGSINFTRQ